MWIACVTAAVGRGATRAACKKKKKKKKQFDCEKKRPANRQQDETNREWRTYKMSASAARFASRMQAN
jgi:hypothetical protein